MAPLPFELFRDRGQSYSEIIQNYPRAPLNNADGSQVYRRACHLDVTLLAYVRTPKSDNEEGGLACKPLRAEPKAPICVVVLLAKD